MLKQNAKAFHLIGQQIFKSCKYLSETQIVPCFILCSVYKNFLLDPCAGRVLQSTELDVNLKPEPNPKRNFLRHAPDPKLE